MRISLSYIILVLALSAVSCAPNFKPDESAWGPIRLCVDYSRMLPQGKDAGPYILRLSMYCYDSETDDLVGQSVSYPDPQLGQVLMGVRGMEREKAYNVAVIADYLEKQSEEYNKQRWYHILSGHRTDMHLERTDTRPSAFDALGYFTASLCPGEEEVFVSLSPVGIFGKVEVTCYEQTENVSWAIKTAFRFAPFNPYVKARVDSYISGERESDCYFIPYDGSSHTVLQFTSAAVTASSSTLDLLPYSRFRIRVDALSGNITLQDY